MTKKTNDALRRRLNATVAGLSVPFFLVIWELASRSGIVNPILFPPPSVVAVALIEWVKSGQFTIDLAISV
ncbi:MAG: ABC transporter permease, partial [Pseudolabrys sp.]